MSANTFNFGENERDQSSRVLKFSEGETTVLGQPRIVIIEDEFFVAWDLQSMLRDLNFGPCEIARDAESGVDSAITHEAELLLVDVNLGDGPDGVEAVRRIREYRKVSVIFITAYNDEANLKSDTGAGAQCSGVVQARFIYDASVDDRKLVP